jgi:hypothetical protein
LLNFLESENSSGFEVRDSAAIENLRAYNPVTQASRETSGRYLERRMTEEKIENQAYVQK